MTVATIGHANPNKRIDQLLMAIGASGLLRSRCRLRVIGEASAAERARLSNIAATVGMAPPEFTGWVNDDDLRWQLRDVDAISCLRNPVLEGASASLVMALASGRPTLVTDHGCYTEVPRDVVMTCRPEHEALDAMRHLERLVMEPGWGVAMGRRGQSLALQRHTPAAYADALLPLLEKVVTERPLRDARRAMFGSLFELGITHGDPSIWRAGVAVDGMGARPKMSGRDESKGETG